MQVRFQVRGIAVHTAAGIWSPHNYKNEFLGAITLRPRAL